MGFRQRIGNAQLRSGPIATPDVTITLTGVSAAGTIGALAVALTVGLTQVAAAGSAGAVAPQATIGLTQAAAAGTTGSLAPQATIGLVQVAGTGTVGALTPTNSIGLTGASGTGSTGALAPATTVALSQVAATGSAGSLASSRSTPLVQVAGTGAAGSLSPTASVALAQVAATGSAGALASSRSIALVQGTAAGSIGTLAPSTTVGLTGVSAVGSAGNLTPPGNVTVTLSQVAATGSIGTLTPQVMKALVGVSAAGSSGLLAPGSSVALSQAAAAGSIGAFSKQVTVALVGVRAAGSVGTLTPAAGRPALHGVRTTALLLAKHALVAIGPQASLVSLGSRGSMADAGQLRTTEETGNELGAYARTVLASNPIHYWRMSAVSGEDFASRTIGIALPDLGYGSGITAPTSLFEFAAALIAGDPDLATISHGNPLTLAAAAGTGGPDFTYEAWLRYDETRRLRFGDHAAITAKVGDVFHLDQPLVDFAGVPLVGPWELGVTPSVAQYTGPGTFDGVNIWTNVPDSGVAGWPFVTTGAGVSSLTATGNTPDGGTSTNSMLAWGGFPTMAVGDKFATSLGYSIDRHFRFVCNNTGPVELISTTLPVVGATYHVAVTRANTNVAAFTADYALYVNGILEASVTGAPFDPNDLHPRPRISGVRAGTPMGPIDGVIDEVAMYESALPAGEVAGHYLAGLDASVPRVGLTAIVRTLRNLS